MIQEGLCWGGGGGRRRGWRGSSCQVCLGEGGGVGGGSWGWGGGRAERGGGIFFWGGGGEGLPSGGHEGHNEEGDGDLECTTLSGYINTLHYFLL